MLDSFTILTKGGVVLWSKEFIKIKGSPINTLIKKVLIEERSADSSFQVDSYSLKWTFANEFDLIFIVVYQKIFTLMYIDELLTIVKKRFIKLYKDTLISIKNSADFIMVDKFKDFEFEVILEQVENQSKLQQQSQIQPKRYEDTDKGKLVHDQKKEKAIKEGRIDKLNQREKKKQERSEKKRLKKKEGANQDSDDDDDDDDDDDNDNEDDDNTDDTDNSDDKKGNNNTKLSDNEEMDEEMKKLMINSAIKKSPGAYKPKNKNTPGKKENKKQARKWDDSKMTKEEMEQLNKSAPTPTKTEVVKEKIQKFNIDMEVSSDEEDKPTAGFMKYFNVLTGNRVINKQDLEPILNDFKQHLTKKNVAADIADKLVESIGNGLTGKKLSTFQGVKSVVKQQMEETVTRVLTPKRNIDILREVQSVKGKRPYTIVFSGVNGVGKSTNLAKICYWLTAHGYRCMLAACDTFRSGAIEQLKTHADRLNVPLYERGYSKDAANVAADAIAEAKETGIDVVLIDTTGRMQNNEPLMKALSKLVNQNNVDLVLFVGEALVGNDGVDQLTKFDKSLSLLSSTTSSNIRTIDGIILTKFDTIDDKVGAAISMVYSTGHPILFLGTGQNYTDLKRMNIKQVVKSLLQ